MGPGLSEEDESAGEKRAGARTPNRAVRHVELAYRRYAPVYDRLFGAVLEQGRRAMAQTASQLCNGSRLALLEVGVGTGLTLPLYSPGIAVTGIDVSEDMLSKARKRAAALADRDIHLHIMNGERMAFPDGAFDCVALPYVLSVTPEPARLVAEVRRVCRKGGSIIIVNHFSGTRSWWMLERMVRPMAERIGFRSDFDFAEHVMRHDWKVQTVSDVNLLGLSKLVTIRND